jgi:acyl-CoA dehydrogenase
MKHVYVPRTTTYLLNPEDELNDLRMSEQVRPLYDHVRKFIRETVEPMSAEFYRHGENKTDRWSFTPGQLEVLGKAKAKAKEEGLWNFFLPDAETGEGLKNLDYAYIAAELGKSPLASETMNCSAPDTGNMEVIERVGTREQKEKWLKPLLNGEIRSAYAMTEPNVASSDAKNISTTAKLVGDEWVINGEKYYISGLGDPRCKIMIVMVKTNPDAPPSKQQSQILVPKDTPGVEIIGPMHVFGHDHAPRGHMHLRFNNVRVPKDNMLLGEGRGYEISQLRLGPGRIHHCMRTIGKAEKGARPDGLARAHPRGLRQEDRPSRRQSPDHRAGALRDRGDAADGAESRESDGRARQQGSPHLGQHGESHGARARLQDHRPGDPDAWCDRHLAMDPACRNVPGRAAFALCRRSR